MIKSLRYLGLVAMTAGSLVACSNDPTDPDGHAEEVSAIRLTIGNQVITIAENGSITGGPLVLPMGNSTLTAEFLDPDGEVIELHDDEFRLDVTSDATAIISFNRTGPFGGALAGTAAGQTILRVSIFHLEENHADFGPHPLPVTVSVGIP